MNEYEVLLMKMDLMEILLNSITFTLRIMKMQSDRVVERYKE